MPGMPFVELDEATGEAKLSWRGRRRLFCSETCLRRFLESPDRYEPSEAPGERATEP
jgi:YHS domain-containing protein